MQFLSFELQFDVRGDDGRAGDPSGMEKEEGTEAEAEVSTQHSPRNPRLRHVRSARTAKVEVTAIRFWDAEGKQPRVPLASWLHRLDRPPPCYIAA